MILNAKNFIDLENTIENFCDPKKKTIKYQAFCHPEHNL